MNDSVSKNRSSVTKRGVADISDNSVEEVSSVLVKNTEIGNTVSKF